jgi:hypothetical protein
MSDEYTFWRNSLNIDKFNDPQDERILIQIFFLKKMLDAKLNDKSIFDLLFLCFRKNTIDEVIKEIRCDNDGIIVKKIMMAIEFSKYLFDNSNKIQNSITDSTNLQHPKLSTESMCYERLLSQLQFRYIEYNGKTYRVSVYYQKPKKYCGIPYTNSDVSNKHLSEGIVLKRKNNDPLRRNYKILIDGFINEKSDGIKKLLEIKCPKIFPITATPFDQNSSSLDWVSTWLDSPSLLPV